ncbi:MAG: ribosome recycling factor [Chlamydiia bacterium]|nr:ribosome recycling factor [Chlamydiia bacterium]
MSQIEKDVKGEMQKALDHLKSELKALRTGRASSAMLDKVTVEVYGSHLRLKELANVTVPEPRQILVTPFDLNNVHAIKKGIESANLGINPMVDGKVIRINVPPMDESIRKQIAKQCKELGEKAKIVMRDLRRKFNDLVRKQKAEGVLSEDLMKKNEKMIQDWTDRFCKDIETACSEKEKEIMTV